MSDSVNEKDVKQDAENAVNATAVENTASVVNEANGAVAGKADDEKQAMAAMLIVAKKQLFLQRITTLATVGIFVVVLVAMLVLVPKVTMTLTNIDKMVADASSSVENINAMVAEMTEASKNLNQLVNDNTEPLTQAVNNMAGIDFEGLNKAITDLQATVGPMAQFFGRFK